MKLASLLLAASVATNVALLAAFAVKPSLAPPAFRDYFSRSAETASDSAAGSKSSPDARARAAEAKAGAVPAQLWQTLYSADLPTLVARLRRAGFSPPVIREIINAQLEHRFSARLNPLVAQAAAKPFWKADNLSGMGNTKLYEELNQIARERSRLLRELLGDDFFASAGSDPNVAQRRRYGDIPKHKIDLVQRIADDYAEMISQVRTATQGIVLPEDREKLALLDRERRADLAAVLAPEELEEFEMRSSTLTSRLRATMTYMNASEEEFRSIFRVYQPFAETLFPSGPITPDQRQEAQQKVFDELKTTLGEPRFSEFARANNTEFQQLARLAQSDNISNDAVLRAFALRDAASAESNRIMDDTTANVEQKRVAFAALTEQLRAQAVALLGAKQADTYLKNTNWFRTLERESAFNFRVDGSTTRVRPLPRPGRPSAGDPSGATPPSPVITLQ